MSWIVALVVMSVAGEPGGVALPAAPSSARLLERLPPVGLEASPAAYTLFPEERVEGDSPLFVGTTMGTVPGQAPAPVFPTDALGGTSAETTPLDLPPETLDVPEVTGWTRPAWFKPWKGSFEVGLDGSAGNNETLNIRLGFDAKRETEQHVLSLDLDYHKSRSLATETANRLFFEGRYDRPLPGSPWSWFVQDTTTYDEFQPWDVRVSSSTGVGYRFLKTEWTTLAGRFGGGFSREIGGPDDRYVPELNYAADLEHQLNKRQKIKASVEYYPDVTAFGDFRVVSKADWELLLDEEMNLSLKLSATDRYKRPNPGGKLNDVDYSVVLLWKF
ncbi:MAG: DUF481 domain-containing protein [Pirellulales bacterium]|nr:DUF481 domain-containing protein [Pirellulales bacterium]